MLMLSYSAITWELTQHHSAAQVAETDAPRVNLDRLVAYSTNQHITIYLNPISL
jgi:hypothetical protein